MTEPTSGAVAAPFDLDALDFAKQGGLLPAVVQDARTRRVLMLGYMDRAAVEATGKMQVILAGITTDVCTAFVALSLVEAGYTVFANSDASGTFDVKTATEANERMRHAGVQD